MTTQDKTREVVMAYYESWSKGPGSKCDSDRLRKIFTADLVFESPHAPHLVGAEHLVAGCERVSQKVKSVTILQSVFSGDDAAVMYDADLTEPAGVHRLVELFRVRDGKIAQVRLVYDATPFRALQVK